MSTEISGFEVTPEDVSLVCRQLGKAVSAEGADELFRQHIQPRLIAIQAVALQADELEQQTVYAHAEIQRILKQAGLF